MGRETFLLPVRWEDGWPRFLDPGEPVPPVVPKPDLPPSPGTDWSQWREDFEGVLPPGWLILRTPAAESFARFERGALAITPRPVAAGSLGKPAFVGWRLRHHAAAVETSVEFAPTRAGDFAGLLALMDENHFLAIGIENVDGRRMAVVRRRISAEESEHGEPIASAPLPEGGAADLRLALDGGRADFAYRLKGQAEWLALGDEVDVEPLASVHAGLFTGVVIGPYAVTGS